MSKFKHTNHCAASGAAAAYFTTEKVKPLNHVSMKKSLHSKKILKLSKLLEKLAITKIWQLILSKTTNKI